MPAFRGTKRCEDVRRCVEGRPPTPQPAGGVGWRSSSSAAGSAAGGAGRSHLVAALAELLDDLRAEGGKVFGLAARDEPLFVDHFLVAPATARVADVGFQRGPRRDRALSDEVSLDERPRTVPDEAAALAFGEDRRQAVDGAAVVYLLAGMGPSAGRKAR